MDAALADRARSLSERIGREGWSLLAYDIVDLFRAVACDGDSRDPADVFCLLVSRAPSMGAFLSETVPMIVAGWRPGLEHLCALPPSSASPSYHWQDELADALQAPEAFARIVDGLTKQGLAQSPGLPNAGA